MSSTTEPHTAAAYKTCNRRWRAADGDFDSWSLDGVALAPDGSLQLAGSARKASLPSRSAPLAGEAVSPDIEPGFAFAQAIPSWSAVTPEGTWIEAYLRARTGGRWTKWYNLGVWASDASTMERHSVKDQRDEDGTVSTDTLLLSAAEGADALQIKLRLLSTREGASPAAIGSAVAISTRPGQPETFRPGNPALWGRTLDVPQCSQMVYPDGGNVWCSPTSVSMTLAFWTASDEGCEARVRAAVAGVYDPVYDGHGNWPFNTAYAATFGLESYVARFESLAALEPWIAAGVPLVISYAWSEGELDNAPVRSSDGHLGVLCGFDREGNPIMNDPAARTNDAVRRTYNRHQFERIWLEHSGGTVYIIHPPGHPTPPN